MLEALRQICVWGLDPRLDQCSLDDCQVKILKNFSMDLNQGSFVRTFSMAFRPGNMNDVIVGTGNGQIIHCVRHGRRASPSHYQGPQGSSALSVQFSPHLPSYFLASYSSGLVSLYHQDNPEPVLSWDHFSSHPIVEAFWLPSMPQVFLVYNIHGTVFVFNLLKDPLFPVTTAQLDPKGSMQVASLCKVM